MKTSLLVQRMLVTVPLLLFAGPVVGSPASSSASALQERGGRPPPPPDEAFEACEGQSVGDSCSFSGRDDETVSGTCREDRRDPDRLLCVPNDAPPPPND